MAGDQNEKIDLGSASRQKNSSPSGADSGIFEDVLERVEKRMEENRQKRQGMKSRNPMLSESLYKDDVERKVKQSEAYNRKKKSVAEIRTGLQEMRNLRSELRMSPEQKEAQIRAQAKSDMSKTAKEMAGTNLTVKQKVAVRIAGGKALDVLYSVAQKMEKEVEKGGMGASFIIMATYLIAFIKDCSDLLVSGIPGLGLITGIIFGTILAFFWLLACGSWHGGYVTNKILRKILVRILAASVFESIPFCGFVPTYIVLNLWSHMDFRKTIKEAENQLFEVNENIARVEKEMRSQPGAM